MKRDALTHPKMLDLASLLGISRAHAVGVMNLLFDFTATHAPQGDIGKHRNGSISMACDWHGDADAFVDALIQSGWVDTDASHRLLVHDWPVHCEQWVKQKLTKLKLDFAYPSNDIDSTAVPSAVATAVTTVERTEAGVSDAAVPSAVVAVSRDLPYPTQPNPTLAQPLQLGSSENCDELPVGIKPPKNWGKYLKHFRELNNGISLGASAREQKLYELMSSPYADEADAIIDYTIARNLKHLILTGEHKGPKAFGFGGGGGGAYARKEIPF